MSSKSNESIENESDENEEIQVIEVIDNGSEGKRKFGEAFPCDVESEQSKKKRKVAKISKKERKDMLKNDNGDVIFEEKKLIKTKKEKQKGKKFSLSAWKDILASIRGLGDDRFKWFSSNVKIVLGSGKEINVLDETSVNTLKKEELETVRAECSCHTTGKRFGVLNNFSPSYFHDHLKYCSRYKQKFGSGPIDSFFQKTIASKVAEENHFRTMVDKLKCSSR